jgi:hypothetical protein
MAISHLPSRWASSPSTARILAFITLLLPLPSVARAQAAAAVPIADSAHAVAIACAVVLALRPPAKRYRCQVERYQETPTGYVIRVHEQVPRGAAPLVFERSEVLLSKTEPSVVVTRAPEL